MKLLYDQNQLRRLHNGLQNIPDAWRRDDVMMEIFRKASKPLLSTTESLMYARVPNLAMSASKHLSARKDKTGTILRVGMVAKDSGKLGYIFDQGTKDRTNYSSGRYVGSIKPSFFWRDAVALSETKVGSEIDRLADRTIDKYIKKHLG